MKDGNLEDKHQILIELIGEDAAERLLGVLRPAVEANPDLKELAKKTLNGDEEAAKQLEEKLAEGDGDASPQSIGVALIVIGIGIALL